MGVVLGAGRHRASPPPSAAPLPGRRIGREEAGEVEPVAVFVGLLLSPQRGPDAPGLERPESDAEAERAGCGLAPGRVRQDVQAGRPGERRAIASVSIATGRGGRNGVTDGAGGW